MILQPRSPPFQFHWPNYHCKTPARCHNHQSTVGKSTWIWGGFLRPSGQSDDIWLHPDDIWWQMPDLIQTHLWIHPPKKINQFCALVRSRFVNSGLVHCAAQPLIDQGQTPCASRALLPVGAKVTKWIYASLCHFLGWFPLSCQKPGDEVTIMCPSCRRKKKLWSISRQPAT